MRGKMRSRKWMIATLAAGAYVLLGALAIHALTTDGLRTLSEAETKSLLRELPYRFEFQPVHRPQGASGAVAGRVIGPHRTVVRFGVSLGRGGAPVSLGPYTDLGDATGGETFRVTDDAVIVVNGTITEGRQIHTKAQWNESATMIVDIEEKLCKATEGKLCAI